MNGLKKLASFGALAASLGGCYAYAGPPRHAYHPRHERVVVVGRPRPAPVVVVHERQRPVVVRERVVVHEDRRHRHHDHDRD